MTIINALGMTAGLLAGGCGVILLVGGIMKVRAVSSWLDRLLRKGTE